MRISDWSSDVCSSDLRHLGISLPARLRNTGDQAVIGQFPQHHAAELKLTIISAGPSGHRATVADPGGVRIARKLRLLQTCDEPFGLIPGLVLGNGLQLCVFVRDRKSTRLNSRH